MNNPLTYTDPSGFFFSAAGCLNGRVNVHIRWASSPRRTIGKPKFGCFVNASGCYGQFGAGGDADVNQDLVLYSFQPGWCYGNGLGMLIANYRDCAYWVAVRSLLPNVHYQAAMIFCPQSADSLVTMQ